MCQARGCRHSDPECTFGCLLSEEQTSARLYIRARLHRLVCRCSLARQHRYLCPKHLGYASRKMSVNRCLMV